jgi:hypothetical protein
MNGEGKVDKTINDRNAFKNVTYQYWDDDKY